MITVVLFLQQLAVNAETAFPRTEFVVFDSLLYRGKPDLTGFGMRSIRGVNEPQGSTGADGQIEEVNIRNAMSGAVGFNGVVYLDFEMWDLRGAPPHEVAGNVAKYILVAQIARDVAPKASFGYYGLIPCREYWGLVSHDLKKLREWRECNRQGEFISEHVQVLFPSLYTFYNDQKSWDIYAQGMIDAARLYKKPVYVFLWPEFHPSNAALKGKNIPSNFWRHELEFCRTRADGIVIWGGWQEQWEEDAAWWVETKKFMSILRTQQQSSVHTNP